MLGNWIFTHEETDLILPFTSHGAETRVCRAEGQKLYLYSQTNGHDRMTQGISKQSIFSRKSFLSDLSDSHMACSHTRAWIWGSPRGKHPGSYCGYSCSMQKVHTAQKWGQISVPMATVPIYVTGPHSRTGMSK